MDTTAQKSHYPAHLIDECCLAFVFAVAIGLDVSFRRAAGQSILQS